MTKTLITETPIKCPRCFDKIDPDCKGCKGTGLVTKTETVTEQETLPLVPAVEPYYPWYAPCPNWVYPGVTYTTGTYTTGTTISLKTCDACGGTGSVDVKTSWRGYLLTNGPLGAETHYSTSKQTCPKCGGSGQITEIK